MNNYLVNNTTCDKTIIDNYYIAFRMAWVHRQFSNNEYNRAAKTLAKRDISKIESEDVYNKINNFRSAHSFVLNTFRGSLTKYAQSVDAKAIITQRTKRLKSIKSKIERYPNITLSVMQDIAGCRAVVKNAKSVYRIVDKYKKSSLLHQLKNEDNYIENPKHDGYRSYHLVYVYRSRNHSNPFNGLKIEIQIRSKLQHYWATAVEIIDTMLGENLKLGKASDDYARFFALMSSVIAIKEKCPPVPNTPTTIELLRQEIIPLVNKLRILDKILGFGTGLTIIDTISEKDRTIFLLKLDVVKKQVWVKGFTKTEIEQANKEYTKIERRYERGNNNVVLVQVDKFKSLKTAYPNYFLATKRFASLIKEIVKK